jgi:hypothetical protein
MPHVWTNRGVSFKNLKPQTVWAMERVQEVYLGRALNCIYTSIWREVVEGEFSLHPFGYAFDTDTDKILAPQVWRVIADEARDVLGSKGSDFQVVAHDVGSGWHLHTEVDAPWVREELGVA